MNNFKTTIGIEVHTVVNSKTKMFSNTISKHNDEVNKNINEVDIALPGTLPTVNEAVVQKAICLATALHMTINKHMTFDRKNYFYRDLPKGYQITQQDRPIGSEGYLEIETSNGKKTIGVERLHMEEDTCKQLHSWDCSLLDYNRAGIPLIEIVSCPDMHSGEEAMKYVEKIRSIVSFLEVSDGKMEEGSLRCDVNVSVKDVNSKELGTKVEIKNLNSIANIQKAIDFEIARQQVVILTGGKVIQETKRYDEGIKETVTMRLKTDSVDYKYFTEPNIVPIKLSKEFIANAIDTSPELAEAKLARYQSLGLNEYDCGLLISNKESSDYFDLALANGGSAKLLANWILVDIQAILNKQNITISEFKISPKHLSELVKLIEKGDVSNKQARELFSKMLENDEITLVEGLLKVNPRHIRITSASDEKIYDATPLTNTNYVLEYINEKGEVDNIIRAICEGESETINIIGTITDVLYDENNNVIGVNNTISSHEIYNNGVNVNNNYIVDYCDGTLTINRREISLYTESLSKQYAFRAIFYWLIISRFLVHI